jgi:hypothetical protein
MDVQDLVSLAGLARVLPGLAIVPLFALLATRRRGGDLHPLLRWNGRTS